MYDLMPGRIEATKLSLLSVDRGRRKQELELPENFHHIRSDPQGCARASC